MALDSNSSTVHYFQLYNDNVANTTLPFGAVAAGKSTVPNMSLHNNTASQHNYTLVSPLTPSTSFESTTTVNPTTPTIPLVTATTLTITSTIINNYSSQNHSNYTNNNNISGSNANNSYSNLTSSISNNFNQSTLYPYKSSNVSSDDNNFNDSAKISYESGSNFMLLLEDFGEYFYNYNGSDFNSSISIYQANCSLTNSTSCGDVSAREYLLLFLAST